MNKGDLTSETREYYDTLIGEIGESYVDMRWSGHPVRSSHYSHTREVLERLLDEVGRREHVLEVGAGPATWTGLCLAMADRMTLLDVSNEMLKSARSRLSDPPNVEFLCGDFVEDMPALHQVFDLVFSARALEYMSDKRQAVDRVWKYLLPGGRFILVTKNPDWRDKRREERRYTHSGSSRGNGLQRDWVGWRTLMAWMKERGFEQVEAFPVAFGSYEWPVSQRLGVAFSDVARKLWGNRPMHRRVDWITESYAVIGRKPDL